MMKPDNMNTSIQIADALLQINAIKLNVKNPFTWASGMKSPIYCDNRQILSYPAIRSLVAGKLADMAKDLFPQADLIAGVATGAIAHGVLVADRMGKGFVYARSAPKGHGLGNQVEGKITPGAKTLVIEDLVSTGKSSLEALEALSQAGCKVLGMLAIFTYELPIAVQRMKDKDCPLYTLSNFSALIHLALEKQVISSDEYRHLMIWREDPEQWSRGVN
jgi:orotate phosphoribosyltransferase